MKYIFTENYLRVIHIFIYTKWLLVNVYSKKRRAKFRHKQNHSTTGQQPPELYLHKQKPQTTLITIHNLGQFLHQPSILPCLAWKVETAAIRNSYL